MRVIFFGTPEFAVPSLKALLESGEEVVAAVTQPDRVKGRGHKLSSPPVKDLAVSRGIPLFQPAGIRSDAFFEEMSSLKPEVIAVVAYGRILPPSILKLPPLGCVNVHGSLLPKYRGAAPIQQAIIHGEKTTGITTMLMDEGLDTGDMLLQVETEIGEEEDAQSLGARLSEMGAALLEKTIKGLREKTVHPVAQRGEPSYAPPLKKEDGRIDWSRPARDIFNLVRGTFPWPGAYSFLNGEKITIIRSKVVGEDGDGLPGRIERAEGDEFHISAGRGMLGIIEVKPEGKKAMAASAFINGRRLRGGMVFNAG